MRIFLIHGMGRSSLSFFFLARRLKQSGYDPITFDYLVSVEKFDNIVERFLRFTEKNLQDGEDYVIIGHSLGGIITRSASPRLPSGLRAFVMLGPPNHPPGAARFIGDHFGPIWRLFTGESGKRLRDADFYAKLPIPSVPTLVLAGTAGPRTSRIVPWLTDPNDGIVSVPEARLEGAEVIEVSAVHTFIMNGSEVAEKIFPFLEKNAP